MRFQLEWSFWRSPTTMQRGVCLYMKWVKAKKAASQRPWWRTSVPWSALHAVVNLQRATLALLNIHRHSVEWGLTPLGDLKKCALTRLHLALPMAEFWKQTVIEELTNKSWLFFLVDATRNMWVWTSFFSSMFRSAPLGSGAKRKLRRNQDDSGGDDKKIF